MTLGLAWLAAHQDPDGRWDGADFARHDPPDAPCSGPAQLVGIDPGLTALALTAFAANGHTHRYGTFKDNVDRGRAWLVSQLDAGGGLRPPHAPTTFNHATAACALADLYGRTKSARYRAAAEIAVSRLVATRHPDGAWGRDVRDVGNDLEATGWCVLALWTARSCELEIGGLDLALREALRWIESLVDSETGATLASTAPAGPAAFAPLTVTTATVVATLCRQLAGYRPDDVRLVRGRALLERWPGTVGVGREPLDLRARYFFAQGMLCGPYLAWAERRRGVRVAWLTEQRLDAGSERGSWDPGDAWGDAGGRVYSTAMNLMALGCFGYRYPKVFR